MLSVIDPAATQGRTRQRNRALAATVLRCGRTARLGRVAGTVALGAIPLLVSIARDADDLGAPLTVLGIVAGASIGWIADDPTTELLTPCPISGPRRMLIRAAFAALVVGACVGALVLIARVTVGLPSDASDRIAESAAAGGLALAVGLALWRRGDPFGGISAVATGLLGPVTIVALAVRWPESLPTVLASPVHARWWLIAGAGLVAAAYNGRDPARR